ncbi:MAG: CoA ester lyase [Candidatus Contendobacter sp.]|nr:CoA ester lyase [Candidatus Contendobacter sp.]MDG4559094.1 CoA ester lyase [Candidatus Contendobacter sp.]
MGERLERSVLLAPASNWGMIQKTAAARADAVCIDLEDAVAPDEKEASRANVVRAYRELDFGNKLRMFRMNGLDTHFAYRDLIEIVEAAGDRIDLIVIPKVNRPEDVYVVETLLGQIESYKKYSRPIGIEALIETALGCVNIREIAACSERLEGFVYGPGDYAASVRMPMESIGELDENDRIYPGHRWHHVMHSIVSAAKAYNKRAIDGPFAGIKNADGLTQACRIGRAMGFDGKWCIHPSQIETVNQTFVPSEKEIDWARTVLNEYEAALREGRGAISVKGKMIDVASLRMCGAIVERAKLAGLLN